MAHLYKEIWDEKHNDNIKSKEDIIYYNWRKWYESNSY